ncbi:MAG: transglutaminase-like domain-containing protein [Saprospiraceae bacterium]
MNKKFYYLLILGVLIGCDNIELPIETKDAVGFLDGGNPSIKEETLLEKEGIAKGIQKTFSFDVGKKTHNLDLIFDESVLAFYQKAPKSYSYTTPQLPDNWEEVYYNMFLKNEKDKAFMVEIIRKLYNLKSNMTRDEMVTFVVAFVQGGLEYDWEGFYDVNDKLNYPYETIFAKKGVCSDKSLTLSRLLTIMGYETVLLTFPKANHMAVGIRVPEGFGNMGTPYAYIETTNYSAIGRVPEKFVGDIKIEENPIIIQLENSGKRIFEKIKTNKIEEKKLAKKYGAAYINASAASKSLIESMTNLKTTVDSLKKELEILGCEGSVSEEKYDTCENLQEKINKKVNRYNQEVEAYNALNDN